MLQIIDSVIEDDNLKFVRIKNVLELFDDIPDNSKSLLKVKTLLESLQYTFQGTYTDAVKPISSYEEYAHIINDYDFMNLPRIYGVLKSLANEPAKWLPIIGKYGIYALTHLASIIIKDVSRLNGEGYLTSGEELEDEYPGILDFLEHDTIYLDYVIFSHNVQVFRTYIIGLCAYYNTDINGLSEPLDKEMDSVFQDILSDYVLDELELEYTSILYNDYDNVSLLQELISLQLVYVKPNGTVHLIVDEPELELSNFNYDIHTWFSFLIKSTNIDIQDTDSLLLDDVGFENQILEGDVSMDGRIVDESSNVEDESSLDEKSIRQLEMLNFNPDIWEKDKHILDTQRGRFLLTNKTDIELAEIISKISKEGMGTFVSLIAELILRSILLKRQ